MNDATATTPSPPRAPASASPPHDWLRTDPPPLSVTGIAYFAPIYEYAVLADRKASFFMSAGGLMLTVLGFFLGRIIHVLDAHGRLSLVFGAMLATVVVLVVVAGITAYFAFSRLLPPMPPTLAVFRDIAARSPEEYARDVRALTHAEAFTHMLRYNHVVAAWGARKFRLVNRALLLLRVAIPLWMLSLLVLAIAG